jgi:hypothetical protein
VERITCHVGSYTLMLEGKGKAAYVPFVRLMVANAYADGLDVGRIYRAASILPPACRLGNTCVPKSNHSDIVSS